MYNLQSNYITILSQKQQYIVNYHKRQAIFLFCWRAVRDSGEALGSIADERPWPLVPRQSTTSCPLFIKTKKRDLSVGFSSSQKIFCSAKSFSGTLYSLRSRALVYGTRSKLVSFITLQQKRPPCW